MTGLQLTTGTTHDLGNTDIQGVFRTSDIPNSAQQSEVGKVNVAANNLQMLRLSHDF